jgi:DNA-binding NarL/FixJ family response regulator
MTLVSGATRARPADQDTRRVSINQGLWAEQLDRVAHLSAREFQVFLKLGEGHSNRAIAGHLGIAERTVKAHVAQIMKKLEVDSRLQAGLVSLVHHLLNESSIDGGL